MSQEHVLRSMRGYAAVIVSIWGGALGCQPRPSVASDASVAPAVGATREDSPVGASKNAVYAALADAVAGLHRSDRARARDRARHPVDTLAFFGVDPDATVVELWPGGGWYTAILAPYLRDQGQLIVTSYDPNGPPDYYGTRHAVEMAARIETQPGIFGEVDVVVIPRAEGGLTSLRLAEPETVDVVLTFRNSHGWVARGEEDVVYGGAFAALRPGGVLGVVQHRAPENDDVKVWAKQGYVAESVIVDAAQRVGFVLDSGTSINANPRDTKDYPEGVWALPPTLSAGDHDRARHLEIGESDRMTLRFVKPSP